MTGQERSARGQTLILENRKKLSVSGVEEVLGFDESTVRTRTALGGLIVRGDGLHVESLSVDTGELVVTGEIDDIGYEESVLRSGFFARLFG